MRNVLLGITFATVIVIAYASWGEWATLFSLCSGPLVISLACLKWRKESSWAPLPGLLQATFGLMNSYGVRTIAPGFIQKFFGFNIVGGHRVYLQLRTYDYYLLSVDGSFGFQTSIWLRHVADHLHSVSLFGVVYDSLPLAMALAYVVHLRNLKSLIYIPLVFVLAMSGAVFYAMLPASGPVYLLGTDHFAGECRGFCENLSDTSRLFNLSLVDPKWPRNALPSLHVVWALLVFFVCFDLRSARWVAGLFALTTILATLVTGEHYLVDVITAFPFAAFVWNLRSPNPRNALSGALSLCIVFAWVFLIRTSPSVFWVSPLIPWGMALLTVSCSLYLTGLRGAEPSSNSQSAVSGLSLSRFIHWQSAPNQ